MREVELLEALSKDGNGIQITMYPCGYVKIQMGYKPLVVVKEKNLFKAAFKLARIILEHQLPENENVRKKLQEYDQRITL